MPSGASTSNLRLLVGAGSPHYGRARPSCGFEPRRKLPE